MDARPAPGPIADRTFERGFKIATAGGVAVVAWLYWTGTLSVTNTLHVTLTLLLFPVYLLGVALFLGVWLGYETDERNLEPVGDSAENDSKDP